MVIKKTYSHPKVAFGKNAILLINLGTPSSTSKKDIKKYLKEFLSDNRIIEINKYLWWFILNIIILKTYFKLTFTLKKIKKKVLIYITC